MVALSSRAAGRTEMVFGVQRHDRLVVPLSKTLVYDDVISNMYLFYLVCDGFDDHEMISGFAFNQCMQRMPVLK